MATIGPADGRDGGPVFPGDEIEGWCLRGKWQLLLAR